MTDIIKALTDFATSVSEDPFSSDNVRAAASELIGVLNPAPADAGTGSTAPADPSAPAGTTTADPTTV